MAVAERKTHVPVADPGDAFMNDLVSRIKFALEPRFEKVKDDVIEAVTDHVVGQLEVMSEQLNERFDSMEASLGASKKKSA